MNFQRSDEQQLLAATVRRLLDRRYDAPTRLATLLSKEGWSPQMWDQFAQLGLLGLAIDPEFGGSGMDAEELGVVMEAFGAALVLEPFFSTVVLGATLISACGTPAQKSAILPRIASGELLVSYACAEIKAGWGLGRIETTAVKNAETWIVTGEKVAVQGGDSADLFLTTARTEEGVALFVV